MPAIKTASKDTKISGGNQASSPRRARNRLKKHGSSSALADEGRETEVGGKEKRGRSVSRGRRFLEAVAGRVSLSRSKSRKKSPPPTIEISVPIMATKQVPGEPAMVIPELTPSTDFEDSDEFQSDPPGIQPQMNTGDGAPVFLGNQEISPKRESPDGTPPRQSFRLETDQIPQNISPSTGSMARSISQRSLGSRTQIIDRLITGPATAAEVCVVCNLPVQTGDRYTFIDRVLHRQCFRCYRCGALLENQSVVGQDNVWYCALHFNYSTAFLDK